MSDKERDSIQEMEDIQKGLEAFYNRRCRKCRHPGQESAAAQADR